MIEPSSRRADRVDLGQRQVVVDEGPREGGDDPRQRAQLVARDADARDGDLRDVVLERHEVREVGAREVLGVALRDLFDVDAAHVAEDDDGALVARVPGDGGEVLLDDVALLLDQHARGLLAVDRQREDGGGGFAGLGGGVGELDAARLHAPAREHLRLEHHAARRAW